MARHVFKHLTNIDTNRPYFNYKFIFGRPLGLNQAIETPVVCGCDVGCAFGSFDRDDFRHDIGEWTWQQMSFIAPGATCFRSES